MIDVEVADGKLACAVLALMGIAEHDVSSGEAHCGFAGAFVCAKMQHAGYTERAADNRHAIIALADRNRAPRGEVVKFTGFVNRERCPRIKQDERALCSDDLNRLEKSIDQKDRKLERAKRSQTVSL